MFLPPEPELVSMCEIVANKEDVDDEGCPNKASGRTSPTSHLQTPLCLGADGLPVKMSSFIRVDILNINKFTRKKYALLGMRAEPQSVSLTGIEPLP